MSVASLMLLQWACAPTENETEALVQLRSQLSVAPTYPDFDFTVVDDGAGPRALPSDSTRGTRGRSAELHRLPDGPAPVPDDSPRRALIARAVAAPDAAFRITIGYRDVPFNWAEFRNRGTTSSDRTALIDARQEQLRPLLDPAVEALRGLGATEVTTYWLSPTITATVPGRVLAQIERWADLTIFEEVLEPGGTTQAAYTGEEYRNGMGTVAFIYNGWQGQTGTRFGNSSSPVQIGVLDFNPLMFNHPGFRDAFGQTRLLAYYDCSGTSCVQTTTESTGRTHGTTVLQIALGSIEAGQDAGISDPLQRRRRSGTAPLTRFHYYYGTAYCQYVGLALQSAIEQRDDVLNMSIWLQASGAACTPLQDCGGMNAKLSNASDAGILTVTTMGNTGHNGTCTVQYPGVRRDGLTIGGLASQPVTLNYNTAPVYLNSSEGGMTPTLWYGATPNRAVAITDLIAPAHVTYLYDRTSGVYGYDLTTVEEGTSFAAPAVAGSAALLQQTMYSYSGVIPGPREVLVNMLLMGDGYQYSSNSIAMSGFDRVSGAGRVHMHYPSSQNLTYPWGWGWHVFALGSGDTIRFPVGGTGPESASVTQWKAAMTWLERDLTHMGDIVLRVFDTCPPGGGSPVLLTADMSFDLRKRIQLRQPKIAGRCLEYEIWAVSLPADEIRTVFVADYYHSGSVSNH